MELSEAGLDFIKGFEELRLDCYKDQAGKPTVGWGHLVRPGEPFVLGQRITIGQAQALLRADVAVTVAGVNRALGNMVMLQNAFDACVSLAFNIGVDAFDGSTPWRLAKAKVFIPSQIRAAFGAWNKVRRFGILVPSRGLTRRRAAEADMYLDNDYDMSDVVV